MSGRVTVLMYHAVAEGRACAGADPHYTVERSVLARQLDAIEARGLALASVAGILRDGCPPAGAVALTFDDGHESNALAAADILARGGRAELFVNPSRVGTAGFLDWRALRALSAAGLSIQSHGQTHRYFDELSPGEIEAELAASKREIEDGTGAPCTVFAPPNGRLTPDVPEIARRLGYRALCSSSVGLWNLGGDPWNIPRFAVLASTQDTRFARWIEQDAGELLRLRMRHGVLGAAKAVLGNAAYERVRSRLLAGAP
jgi:peptidoglycan/xylan/chitin deacetylase (PgdA/CDA1 family)